MDYDTLMEWVNAKPFEPFQLVSTDGATYTVHHPSMIWPGGRTVLIGLPYDSSRPDVPGKHITLAIDHIVRVEPLHRQSA